MLVVPDIKKIILLVRKLTANSSFIIVFSSNGFLIKDKHGKTLVKGHKRGGLYALEEKAQQAYTKIQANEANFDISHRRIGHLLEKFLKLFQGKQLIVVMLYEVGENHKILVLIVKWQKVANYLLILLIKLSIFS